MPRHSLVSYDQVAAAAESIAAQHGSRAVSRRAIEDLLATQRLTCSAGTLQKHLNAWRESQPTGTGPAIDLPASIAGAINGEIKRATEAAVTPVRQDMMTARAEAASLAETSIRLEAQIAELDASILALQSERDRIAGVADERAEAISAL